MTTMPIARFYNEASSEFKAQEHIRCVGIPALERVPSSVVGRVADVSILGGYQYILQ